MIQFKILNAGDPERVFFRVFNNEATNALSRGELAQWVTGATGDGSKVARVTDNLSPCMAGAVEDVTIAAQKYGLLQVSGYHDAVLTATTQTVKGVVSGTVNTSIGKANAHTTGTATPADQAAAIIGVVIKVTDTNSSAVYLRLM